MVFHNRSFESDAAHKFCVVEVTSGLKRTKPSVACLKGFITGSQAIRLEAFKQS
jgi:hypothetical protein